MKDDEEVQFEEKRRRLIDSYGFSFEQAELLATLFMEFDRRDNATKKELKKIKKQLKACREGKIQKTAG